MKKKYFEFNELKLTSSHIVIECEVSTSKHELPFVKQYREVKWVSKSCVNQYNYHYYIDWKYDIKCYKIYEKIGYFSDRYGYRIVIDYENYHLVKIIIRELEQFAQTRTYCLTINKNNQIDLVNDLVELNCFSHIIFGKQFNTHEYSRLKFLTNVSRVRYMSRYKSNLVDLPEWLDSLVFQSNSYRSIELLDIPKGVQEILIYSKTEQSIYTIDLTHLCEPKKILFVNSDKKITNLNNLTYDVIVLERANSSIDLTNLLNTVQMIKLYDQFDKSLDWLPDSVVKIVFNGRIESEISNIPSSTKCVQFNWAEKIFPAKLKELPDSIEHIYLRSICQIHIDKCEPIIKLPRFLKTIHINKSSYECVNSFLVEYKNTNSAAQFDIIETL